MFSSRRRQNLHFIMGNMAKRPWQFIVIGLLRSTPLSIRQNSPARNSCSG
jgi:hypothetical protein